MIPDQSAAAGGYDYDDFKTDLAALIDHAHTAGLDIRGGYNVRLADTTAPNYTVEITAFDPVGSRA